MEQNTKKKGRLMIWCENCSQELGHDFFYYSTDSRFSNHCPRCKKLLQKRKCIRCGNVWVPRNKTQLAAVCPKCSSPFWCRERVLKVKKE